MKTKAIILVVLLGVTLSAAAQQRGRAPLAQMKSNFLPAPATQAEVQEDEIYNRATAALNEGQWQKALEAFQEVRKLNGRRADGALYWKAYTENKMGNRAAANASITELRKSYPKSSWLKDASALEIEMKQGTARAERPASDDADDDIKLLAINSLMGSDEERAIPMLQKLLDSNQSPKFKERALFVLSQSDSAKAHQILDSVARGQSHPELQAKAIRNLGINGTQQNRATLAEIYKNSNDVKVKREVLQSLGVAGDKENLFALARTEKSPEMQDSVIQALAVSGADSQLRQLYKESTDVHAKERILKASIITGDKQLVDDVLKTETNPLLRREAIRVLGISGGSTSQLVSMYENEKDKDTKEAAIEALFVSGDAHSLVALARKETDQGMRRQIIEKLSVMGNREANDYLMEILSK